MTDPKVQTLKDTVKKIEEEHSDNPATLELEGILNEKIETLEKQKKEQPELAEYDERFR